MTPPDAPAPGTEQSRKLRLIPASHHAPGLPQPRSPGPPPEEDARWIQPGQSITIHGLTIRDGMVYVGDFLAILPGTDWMARTPDASLIRPSLKVAQKRPNPIPGMGYWSSYSTITPDQRLMYLHWLASGKCNTDFAAGYAFLYFYGLERRLVLDAPAPEEEALLLAEVARLKALYRTDISFQNAATALLDFTQMRDALISPERLENWRPDLLTLSQDMPAALRVKLGLHVLQGIPLDFELAIAATLFLSPAQGGIRQTIATTRGRPEFIALMRERFNREYPEGFRLRDRKSGHRPLTYNPASHNAPLRFEIDGLDHLPDPATLNWTRLTELCDKARDDLTPFARSVGTDRERADTLAAMLILPPDFPESDAVRDFTAWLNGQPGTMPEIPVSDLIFRCLGVRPDTPTLKQIRDVSATLAHMGYGMEPDPGFGGRKPDKNIILFRQDTTGSTDASPEKTETFEIASIILAALGPATRDPQQAAALTSSLTASLALRPDEARRLTARQRTLSPRAQTLTRIRAATDALPSSQHNTLITAALAAVTTLPGDIDPAMVAALEHLYDALALERRDLYTALHHGAAADAPRASDPVTVEQTEAAASGHPIPPASPTSGPASSDILIDMTKVHTLIKETREVDTLLARIYEDEPAEPVTEPLPASQGQNPLRFTGLNPACSRLLETLATQEEWTRDAFETCALTLGLMPDGALEAINEWAYDTFDEELIEDGEPLILNMTLLTDAAGDAS
ncbi:hypothetical protein GOB85_02610 [Acetobacter sp. LMG 1636]|uniref:Tellurite resistance protein TerB n=2 Tax=Acetobacter fallax TaxID=1737473 RepID=A0ABX0KBQ5_9PROT|nr:hypothetical protein [Acetobacter fallax]NHO35021.1 hypothetical protein [Acetobacter fallax]